MYNPAAGVVPYFPTSPFSQQISNPPTVNANSAGWLASWKALGTFAISPIFVYTSRAPNPLEIAFPIYYNHAGSNMPVKIHCTANYGNIPCNVEGMTVYIDPRELPQNGGENAPGGGGDDAHWALIDPTGGYEYTLWATQWPPVNGVLTAAWGGRCALNGNGFTNPSYSGPNWNSGCVATASGTPLSSGVIRVIDLLAAVQSGGVLPQALDYSFGCTGPVSQLPPPFLSGGDGQCPGAQTEGAHMYLAMHDAQVNALGLPAITSVLLRTLDEDHYGAFCIDSGSGAAPGILFNIESDETYAAFGLPSPWLTQFLPAAQSEGLPIFSVPSQNRDGVSFPIPASVGSYVTFL